MTLGESSLVILTKIVRILQEHLSSLAVKFNIAYTNYTQPAFVFLLNPKQYINRINNDNYC